MTPKAMRVSLVHEARNDRMQRALAARQNIRMSGREREQAAAILQYEAGTFDREPRPEAHGHEVALDQRHHVARPIGRGQIGRAVIGAGNCTR
jgi:hypothetical protein